MIIAPPGAPPGRFGADAVSTFDILPTLLDYAGVPNPKLEGISLRNAIEHKKLDRAPLIAHAWRRTAVIDWPLKLLTYRRKGDRTRLLLFDLAADPMETKDLSGERVEDLRRLIAIRDPK